MLDFTCDLGEIESHANDTQDFADKVGEIADSLKSHGAGDFGMYGKTVGLVAYPIATGVAYVAGHSFNRLQKAIEGFKTGLDETINNYRQNEQYNTNLIDSFTNQI